MCLRLNPAWIFLFVLGGVGCVSIGPDPKMEDSYVMKELGKLAPVTLAPDLSYLPENEQKALGILVRAAKHMDHLFLWQVHEGNELLLKELEGAEDPEGKGLLVLFKAMFGPWNRLEEDLPFLSVGNKPPGVSFYPEDMTRDEFEAWLKRHPKDREAFESNFTVIRRDKEKLVAIPYSTYYRDRLVPAADCLREAARSTSDSTLRTYLNRRADAFFSNDYYQSDMDWMDLDGDIEVVIGPYEVYEDKLFGYKAAFEAFVCVVDRAESEKLEKVVENLKAMEANLPIPEEHKNFNRGFSSPVKVVNEVFAAGDTKAGVQTLAFNLPNDERVREAKGSKKVMLKNMMNAKFEKILTPIVEEVLAEKDRKRVSFDGYFNQTLLHEVSHGLGPGKITKDGRETTVNKELKELYSTLEECKADTLGVYNAQYLINQGILPASLEDTLYASYLGGMFRSIRFGIDEAHGGGIAIQLNYYLEQGAFQADEEGRFFVDEGTIKDVVQDLARRLLLIQAEGDYEGAKQLITKYRVIRPEVKAALERIEHVPVDILPRYPIENE